MDSISGMDVVFAVVAVLVMASVIAIVSDRVNLLGDTERDQETPQAKR